MPLLLNPFQLLKRAEFRGFPSTRLKFPVAASPQGWFALALPDFSSIANVHVCSVTASTSTDVNLDELKLLLFNVAVSQDTRTGPHVPPSFIPLIFASVVLVLLPTSQTLGGRGKAKRERQRERKQHTCLSGCINTGPMHREEGKKMKK